MIAYQVDASGKCSTCNKQTTEADILQCYDCQSYLHGVCGETPITNKTFLKKFKEVRVRNFMFVCDHCLTRRENKQASLMKDQISELTNTVSTLVKEFSAFKLEQAERPAVQTAPAVSEKPSVWKNQTRTSSMKASLCIKSKGKAVDIDKIKEIARANSIQVSKADVKDNGDVYVDMPSHENREKLLPLLDGDTFAQNEIVTLKSKLPTISILSVEDFSCKEEFVDKVKQQNPEIKRLIAEGSEFSIVYAKEPRKSGDSSKKEYHQVVARVSEEVRRVIKESGNKVFVDLIAHRVVDRFFVRRCNKCQEYGHYEKDCVKPECCGYCQQRHKSSDCNQVNSGDTKNYQCINCKKEGKPHIGHSSLWHKCPSFVEQQKKVKKSIPYYASKNI